MPLTPEQQATFSALSKEARSALRSLSKSERKLFPEDRARATKLLSTATILLEAGQRPHWIGRIIEASCEAFKREIANRWDDPDERGRGGPDPNRWWTAERLDYLLNVYLEQREEARKKFRAGEQQGVKRRGQIRSEDQIKPREQLVIKAFRRDCGQDLEFGKEGSTFGKSSLAKQMEIVNPNEDIKARLDRIAAFETALTEHIRQKLRQVVREHECVESAFEDLGDDSPAVQPSNQVQ